MKRRVWQALTTWPDARGWLETLAVALGFAAVALLIGLPSGFLHPHPSSVAASPLVLRTLIAPALAEELVFRVAPPPRFAGIALVAYVLYHPLNAWLFVPAARDSFSNPVFLLLAALLGSLCTLLYRRTGSLWPPVALHWLAVVGWLLLLGGTSALGHSDTILDPVPDGGFTPACYPD